VPESGRNDLLRLHHVGYVVSSIDQTIESFTESVNGSWDGAVYHDPIQKVRVTFIDTPGTRVQIELVEPDGEQSPVRAFLAAGGGLHHLCYEVHDCEQALAKVRDRKGMIVRRPKPAVAFQGRRIAWAITAEKLLIEFLEIDRE
jgi:methylmalonyl-CoA/ethylmalonyl-CoA epimerase